MHIHALARTKPMCTLVAIAGIFTSDWDKCVWVAGCLNTSALHPNTHTSRVTYSLCVSIQALTLCTVRIIQCHIPTCRKQLCFYGVNTSGRAAYCACVIVRDYCRKCVRYRSQAHARSSSGKPFWLDARMCASLNTKRIKSSQQLTQGVLSLLKCHSFISSVKTKQYPPCTTLLMAHYITRLLP